MNTIMILSAVLFAATLIMVWPVRRLRRALVGVACLAGGLTAVALVTDCAVQRRWEELSALESTAHASDKPQAEAEPAIAKTLDEELAPRTAVIYPADRPAWVEADFSQETGERQQVAIASGLFIRPQEALRALDEELEKATRDYVSSYLGNSHAGTLVPIDARYIRQHLITPDHLYSEVVQVSVGPMHQAHALVAFDNDFRRELDARWKNIVVSGRVLKLGVIAGGILIALATVFGYFRADTATRGYHTTRLQLASATVLLAVVAGGMVLFRAL
ncbi:MAG TPA: hypothetical protein VL096_01585 [Pirellulaceae bacterium]|nr:hypothetical protein [Pirellulaceae bacterium]